MAYAEDTFKKLKNGLIVSCQAEGNDPFNKPELVALFAKAAIMGGASGIRTEGYEKTKAIVETVDVPVIGLIKSYFPDKFVRITGTFSDVDKLIASGCSIIAIDGTFRKRENLTGPEFISKIKKKYNCLIMADIAQAAEGLACFDAGADCVSTTLSGYTPDTINNPKDRPDFELVKKLVDHLPIPVIAEGKINTPELAAEMMEYNPWAIVVGTAITRPRVVTNWFVNKMKKAD
jgi:N-acylglucosamine-6-phosphate 2-epimerase